MRVCIFDVYYFEGVLSINVDVSILFKITSLVLNDNFEEFYAFEEFIGKIGSGVSSLLDSVYTNKDVYEAIESAFLLEYENASDQLKAILNYSNSRMETLEIKPLGDKW